jgi:protein-S-isoprenylcysteine O-methyltransferase Ste14
VAGPLLALILAVAINSLSVAVQGRTGTLGRMFGRRAWLAHTIIIVPGWAWFMVSLVRSPRTRPRVPPGTVATGLAMEAGGLALVVAGFRRLGPAVLVNGDLFGVSPRRVEARPVPLVSDPIYTGYAAWMAGWALRTGRPRLLPVAGLMLLLLRLEARIEDRAARRVAGGAHVLSGRSRSEARGGPR